LSDPRGLEYRAISVYSQTGIVETRGWVFPENAGDTYRFAVCWSGMVYPTFSVGAAADLKADAAIAIAAAQAKLAENKRKEPRFWRAEFRPTS